MKIHVLQHSPINTLGTIEEYARIKGHRLESTRFYEAKSPPELDSFDLLIIMGGPMGIYDYEENPWEGPFVQKKQEMLGQREYLVGTKEFMFLVLDRFEKMI
jgi:GMP synthase-like glutamine amidotransferase